MFDWLPEDCIKEIFSGLRKSSLFPLCRVSRSFNNYSKFYINNRKTTITDLVDLKWLNISTTVILSKHNPIIEQQIDQTYTLSLPPTYFGQSITYYITEKYSDQYDRNNDIKKYVYFYNGHTELMYSNHNTINLVNIPKKITDNAIGMHYQLRFNVNIVGNWRLRKSKIELVVSHFSKKWERRDIIMEYDYVEIGYYEDNQLIFRTDKNIASITVIIIKGRDIFKDLKNIRNIIFKHSISV